MDTNLEIQYGYPLAGGARERLAHFLAKHGLEYEGGVDFTVNLLENGEIVATGSLAGDTLRYVAVSWTHQSRGLAATIVSEVINYAATVGRHHLFLFTHPRNRRIFTSLGFYEVASTDKALLLENRLDGLESYVASLARPQGETVGCIFADCNPFTNGHRHLIETAAKESDWVHVFILPGAFGELPTEVRRQMAVEGTKHLNNVVVQPISPYLIPPYAFPDYFIEEKEQSDIINCALDLTLFAERIAKPLGITRRYLGKEPHCRVSAAYNREMHRLLPGYGIVVVEVPRLAHKGGPISGGRVRRLYEQGKLAELAELVPASTLELLIKLDKEEEIFAVL